MNWKRINDHYWKCRNYEIASNEAQTEFTLYFQGGKLGRYSSHKDALLAAEAHDRQELAGTA